MTEQISLFDAEPRSGTPIGPPTGFRFLDHVQKRRPGDDPIELFRVRLILYFHKEPFLHDGRLWFRWGESWTFCEAREPEDPALRARGIVDIFRAVWRQT